MIVIGISYATLCLVAFTLLFFRVDSSEIFFKAKFVLKNGNASSRFYVKFILPLLLPFSIPESIRKLK